MILKWKQWVIRRCKWPLILFIWNNNSSISKIKELEDFQLIIIKWLHSIYNITYLIILL